MIVIWNLYRWVAKAESSKNWGSVCQGQAGSAKVWIIDCVDWLYVLLYFFHNTESCRMKPFNMYLDVYYCLYHLYYQVYEVAFKLWQFQFTLYKLFGEKYFLHWSVEWSKYPITSTDFMVPSVEDSQLVTLTALDLKKDGLPLHLYHPEARGLIPRRLDLKTSWMMRYIILSYEWYHFV